MARDRIVSYKIRQSAVLVWYQQLVTHTPRFNSVVKAIENKIKVKTVPKIENLDIILKQQRVG